MNTQKEIQEKQNEDRMLKCQWASRVYFNQAERENYFTLFFGILSAVCVFLPSTIGLWQVIIPIIFDGVCFILKTLVNKHTEIGAHLRKYFDATVLGINPENYSANELSSIKETTAETVRKFPQECSSQISNSGRDDPPGVRDWYEFAGEHTTRNAVFECQKQNGWWNKKLMRIRLMITSVIGIIIIVGFISAFIYSNLDRIALLGCAAALVALAIDSIMTNAKYIRLSIKIDDVIETYDKTSTNQKQIFHLQRLIDERRSIPVLEINFLHYHKSKRWSEQYEARTK